MPNEIITFGKYKGQPVEVLENDPDYAEWLANQSWAKERFPQIVNIIINRFGESEETPEHNAMQAKFMSKKYCAMAYEAMGGFAIERWRLPEGLENWRDFRIETPCSDNLSSLVSDPEFEVGAVDVSFLVESASVHVDPQSSYDRQTRWIDFTKQRNVRLELKPTIGDDYPAVLRQMRNNRSNALVYGEYTGTGVPEQTFRAFFSTQKLAVISEIEISENAKERHDKKISEIWNEIKKIKTEIDRVTAGGIDGPH